MWNLTISEKMKPMCQMTALHGKPYLPFPDALKRWSFQKNCAGTWSFLYYLERWYFFPENMIFFHQAESERRPFPGNTWKHDALPGEEKQETWYKGSKPGLSLNLFGWRYSTMNNPRYFVPSSPQGLRLGVCLGANKGNYLSIRG